MWKNSDKHCTNVIMLYSNEYNETERIRNCRNNSYRVGQNISPFWFHSSMLNCVIKVCFFVRYELKTYSAKQKFFKTII